MGCLFGVCRDCDYKMKDGEVLKCWCQYGPHYKEPVTEGFSCDEFWPFMDHSIDYFCMDE